MTQTRRQRRSEIAVGLIAALLSMSTPASAETRRAPLLAAQSPAAGAPTTGAFGTPPDTDSSGAAARTPPASDAPTSPLQVQSATPGSAPPIAAAPGSPTRDAGPGSVPSATTAGSPPATPDEDIRDIRGPKGIIPAWLLPALIAAAVLLALAGYGAWHWNRRRKRPPVLLPFELALQRLENIRPLMQPHSVREFSIAVSDIVRAYIEERFHITAAHRTTEEFLHDRLQPSDPLARHHRLLEDFLQRCDLAKFAALSLSSSSMESLYQSARTFILETAKPEVAPTPPASKGTQTKPEARDSLPAT